jgi:hypothetical protein
LLEADPKSDLLAPLAPDVVGGAAGRDSARLEDDDVALAGEPGVEERGGNARRLPGARRRAQDEPAADAQRGDDLGKERIDRETHALRQSRAQEPGPRGSPQAPHGAAGASARGRSLPMLTTDRTRSRESDRQAGQRGSSPPRTSSSKACAQARQTYS